MDTCTIETGLLRKHPCGDTAVTKCANCEQPLCLKHAVATMSAGKKTMLCAECAKAWKETEKTKAAQPGTRTAAPHAAAKPEAPRAAAPKPMPAPAAAAKPAEKKPDLSIDQTGPLEFKPAAAAPKPAPAAAKPAEKKPDPKIDDTGPLEFTPSKKK